MHCVNVVGVNVVEYGRYAICDEWKVHKFQIDVQQDVLVEEQGIADKLKGSIGDWVEEEYNTKRSR